MTTDRPRDLLAELQASIDDAHRQRPEPACIYCEMVHPSGTPCPDGGGDDSRRPW